MLTRRFGLLAVLGCCMAFTSVARADLYGFHNITMNNPINAAAGEAQLFVDVTDAGFDQALFTFLNIGDVACSITDVYFDDGATPILEGIAGIDDSHPDVAFSADASPPNLPGGGSITPAFVVSAGLSADSDSPAAPNGVNPGEYLGILMDLTYGSVFSDVLLDLASADLRVGIHVQAFADGGSEAFINPPTPVPAPGAGLLAALGLAIVGWTKRRRTTDGKE